MTAQYVSKVLKRHAESAGLDPEAYSAGFITKAIRAGKDERCIKKHSGHSSWEAFNLCAQGGRDLSVHLEGIGL